MKRLIIVLLAIVVFAATADAQNKKPQFQWSKKYMTEVGLSAEQQTRVDSIKDASKAEMQVVKSDATLSEDAKKAKLKELQEKRLSAIDALLTEDQRKKANEIKARIKAENQGSE